MVATVIESRGSVRRDVVSRGTPLRAVVLSGGLTHDFRTTRACLEEMLNASGFGVEVFDGTAGVAAALSALPGTALLVVTALCQTMTGPGMPDRAGRALVNTGRAPARGHRAFWSARVKPASL